MSALAEFLQVLLYEGKVVLRDRPQPSTGRQPEVIELLGRAYADYQLQVARPPLDFDGPIALAAAELVRQASWFLVSHEQPPEELDRRLTMPGPPRSAAQHLSADLVLRLLPQVHRRARAIDPADPLPGLLATVLRQWPLSGVLSEVEEGPTAGLDFHGHPGLMLLYAERLACHEKPAWVPDGSGFEYVDLVWREMGKDASLLAGQLATRGGDSGE
jgi:hypothetical protein